MVRIKMGRALPSADRLAREGTESAPPMYPIAEFVAELHGVEYATDR